MEYLTDLGSPQNANSSTIQMLLSTALPEPNPRKYPTPMKAVVIIATGLKAVGSTFKKFPETTHGRQ